MEHLDFSKILEKIGPDKDLSRLTEEELLFYDMIRAIQSRGANDERQIIKQVISQSKEQQFKVNTNENRINMKTSNKTWIGIAAGVAIMVVAYYFLWSPTISNEEIFKQNFKPSTEFIGPAKDKAMQYGMAGSGSEGRDSFLQAMALFESGNYDEAMKILGPYLDTHPEDTMARFHLAICQMNRAKYAPALTNLSKLNEISADMDPVMAEEVKFDLALCYLQMTDGRKQAVTLLEQIVPMDGKKANAAKGILGLIKK
jgi:TolA-binding protein